MLIAIAIGVVGILIYALASNAKLAEVGRCLFWCAVFWLVYWFGGGRMHF